MVEFIAQHKIKSRSAYIVFLNGAIGLGFNKAEQLLNYLREEERMTFVKYMLSVLSFLRQRLFHRFKDPEDYTGEESYDGRIVVITGANAGIGKVLTMQMAKRKAIVVMACRDLLKAKAVVTEIKEAVPRASLIVVKLDLSDLESVRSCANEIIGTVPHINLLINNAGYMGTSATIERTKDGFEKNLGTNHLGHFLLTLLLLDRIKKGAPSRIVCVASMAHEYARLNIGDLNMERDTCLGHENMRPYNNSKLCNMLFARELGRRLLGSGVTTYTLCPGLVLTGLFDNFRRLSKVIMDYIILATVGCTPEQGAETIMYCALASECAQETGRVYRFAKIWKSADDELSNVLAKQLWDISEKYVDFKFTSITSTDYFYPK